MDSNAKRKSSQISRSRTKKKQRATKKETFWTLCPYCFYLHEYLSVYQDCCLRCHNCKSPFQGISVPPPTPELLVKGKNEYRCTLGVFGVQYSLNDDLGNKKGGFSNGIDDEDRKFRGKKGGYEGSDVDRGSLGSISDLGMCDCDEESKGSVVDSSEENGVTRMSIAKNTEKVMMGRKELERIKMSFDDAVKKVVNGIGGEECSEDDLEYLIDDLKIYFGDYDIYVSSNNGGF